MGDYGQAKLASLTNHQKCTHVIKLVRKVRWMHFHHEQKVYILLQEFESFPRYMNKKKLTHVLADLLCVGVFLCCVYDQTY